MKRRGSRRMRTGKREKERKRRSEKAFPANGGKTLTSSSVGSLSLLSRERRRILGREHGV